jgi:hypothetical protein
MTISILVLYKYTCFPYKIYHPSPLNQNIREYRAYLDMMKGVHFLAIVALLSLASSLVSAFDPSPLQDICVAIDDPKSAGIYIIMFVTFCLQALLYIFIVFLLSYANLHSIVSCSVCEWKILQGFEGYQGR